ncbi:MAG: hypothetical protein K0Q68_1165 [Moraxellaceae bacterium]|jgi:hypothetical protein|nr:hypothetical protein [Moraxellaceae bacterium]
MAKLLVFVLLIYGAVLFFDKNSSKGGAASGSMVIEENASYVAVYGRKDCGYTRQMLEDLEQSGIEHRFFSLDDKSISGPMHARMLQNGLDTSYYLLPVVEVDGEMSIRPEFSQVSTLYRAAHGGS